MKNHLLKAIFKEIYNKDFDYNDLDDRRLMQSTVYLLTDLGLNIGKYDFTWHSIPYSISLDDELSNT